MPDRAHEIVPLLAPDTISARITTLAREIEADFKDTGGLVTVSMLRGAFMFTADLTRALRLEQEVDFLQVSSYGDATTSSGQVKILQDLRTDISGRDVLIVEDIIDTGRTLRHVIDLLKRRDPAKLRSVSLLDKPSRREIAIEADWTGFTVPDEFVVGYGIDYAQRGRNLPYIGKVQFTGT